MGSKDNPISVNRRRNILIELIAGSIKLREFLETDKTQLARLCNNKKIWDNVRDSLPYPYTEKDAIEFIRLCQKESPKITFAIEKDGVLTGTIGLLKKTDVDRLTAEIGYWIGEPFWGQGIATEAVKLITQYGFDKLGLVRIHTGVFDFNKPSISSLSTKVDLLSFKLPEAISYSNFIAD